jgi:dTDP-4-dehydrorhamnose reductase
VDKAETEQKVAYEINAYGVKLLAEWCATQEANLFHISTDFVFDGEATIPYTEESSTNPLSVYGKSKLEGETAALAYKKSYVIRTSWVYSSHGKNFVKTMLRLASEKPEIRVVNDQWGCPTYAADLADVLLNMATLTISIKQSEIFHYCNNGAITWYDFAKKIIQLSNISTPVIPISTIEYPTPASRPKYSVLDTNKIKNRFNLTIPSWQNSLSRCLHKIPLH